MTWTTRHRDAILLTIIALGVFLSRLPFLSAGYGVEPDAWRVANAARSIAMTGTYSASRLPGYPLQEYFYALIWGAGPFVFNLITAIFSTLGFVFFALTVRHLGSGDFVICGLALAFTPVIYIYSATSMSDVWALSFILGSLYFAFIRSYFIAGLFFGLAIGCRITSAPLLIPILLVVLGREKRLDLKPILTYGLVSLLVGFTAFTPVFLRYGFDFFTFSEVGSPGISSILYRASIGVWGTMGSLAILVAIGSLVLFPAKTRSLPQSSTPILLILSWLLAVALVALTYLRLPNRSRYLVLLIPFALLLLARFLDRRRLFFLCIALIASPFLFTISSAGWYLEGPVFRDHADRVEGSDFIRNVLLRGDQLPGNSVVVAGAYFPFIEANLDFRPGRKAVYVYLLNADQVRDYQKNGFKLYYLPSQRELNRTVYGIDLQNYGAIPLNVSNDSDW